MAFNDTVKLDLPFDCTLCEAFNKGPLRLRYTRVAIQCFPDKDVAVRSLFLPVHQNVENDFPFSLGIICHLQPRTVSCIHQSLRLLLFRNISRRSDKTDDAAEAT